MQRREKAGDYRMLGFKKLKFKSFAVGAATVIVGPTILRPFLVMAARAGLGVAEIATDAWHEAVAETARIKAEAEASRSEPSSAEILAELRALRLEVAAVKTKVGTVS